MPSLNWLSVPKALSLVGKALNCEWFEAISPLQDAIRDGIIEARLLDRALEYRLTLLAPGGDWRYWLRFVEIHTSNNNTHCYVQFEGVQTATGGKRGGDAVLAHPRAVQLEHDKLQLKRDDVEALCEQLRCDTRAPLGFLPTAETASGTIEEAILEAIRKLWPKGIPNGLKPRDRNSQIRAWLVKNKRSVPASDDALAKAVSRALKTIRKPRR